MSDIRAIAEAAGWTADVHGKAGIKPCQFGDYHESLKGSDCPDCGWFSPEDRIAALSAELDAVRGERDKLSAELDYHSEETARIASDAGKLMWERDALAAQVAALAAKLEDEIRVQASNYGASQGDEDKAVSEALANIPAAAAEFLAARKVAEALESVSAVVSLRKLLAGWAGGATVIEALDDWRKAANREQV